ncbi:hypothetical protein FLBR109950_05965 [Flavobacterium branchiophilum]|uniref:Uncharacterized protein n=2 Tax=Flavobacterium branchiophilum TaxID=55197 RepID=G2Z4I1_FLABF|nr:hypothetical protein [Flavobacterium branchiophilum]PDS24468.1 hypothetical protein B0A77_08015 [Flavobacterium branchiophilum]CCB68456.1 Hypothetical protein precursor [Flavobacterium branchiophilum FL-15]
MKNKTAQGNNKFFVLTFILFCQLFNVQAQKYQFDTFLKYAIIDKEAKQEFVSYSNTANDTYFFRIYRMDYSLIGKLFDYKTKKVHSFNIKDSIGTNGTTSLFFKYLNTMDLEDNRFKNDKKHEFTYQVQEETDSIVQVKMMILKKKKHIDTYDFSIKKVAENLIPSFDMCCMHGYEQMGVLQHIKHGIVTKATWHTPNGKTVTIALENRMKINTNIEIP